MSHAYRGEHEAAHASLETILRENAELRHRVDALEAHASTSAHSTPPAKRALFFATLLGAAASSIAAATTAMHADFARRRAAHAPCPFARGHAGTNAVSTGTNAFVAPTGVPQTAPAPPAAPSPMTAAERASTVLRESGGVAWCWGEQLRVSPAREGESFRVSVDVGADGVGDAVVTAANRPGLAECIRGHVRLTRFAAGAPAHLAFNLAADRAGALWLGTEPGNCPYLW